MVKKVVLLSLVFALVMSVSASAQIAHWAFDVRDVPGADLSPEGLNNLTPAILQPGNGVAGAQINEPRITGPAAPGSQNALYIDGALSDEIPGAQYAMVYDTKPTIEGTDPAEQVVLSIGSGDGTVALWYRHTGPSYGGDYGEAIYAEKLMGPMIAESRGYTIYSYQHGEGRANHSTISMYLQNIGNFVWPIGYETGDGEWHHLAITKEAVDIPGVITADILTCYVDGVSLGTHSTAINTEMDKPGGTIWLGKRNPGIWGQTNKGLNGALDEVYLFGEALGAEQIAELAIPEPATMCLLGLGGLALIRKRK